MTKDDLIQAVQKSLTATTYPKGWRTICWMSHSRLFQIPTKKIKGFSIQGSERIPFETERLEMVATLKKASKIVRFKPALIFKNSI